MSNILEITEKQLLRGYVLKIAEQAQPFGAGVEIIHSTLTKKGFQYSKKNIVEACNYLQQKGLVDFKEVKNDVLGIQRSIAKINAKGIDLLEGTIVEEGIEIG
ncbi:MAG: hypothetical protein ACRCW1_06180 [Anaerotignaceae bacterium]